MEPRLGAAIQDAQRGAVAVLIHNAHGPFDGLPRTAGWGYPEPYTRDLLISSLGILASGNAELLASLKRVMATLARNQSRRGHIPSLVHDPEDRGASDTTPLFLLVAGILRNVLGRPRYLEGPVRRAARWMEYQAADDRVMVSQQPTSDWRDEQWVLGHGLFVNTLVYAYLKCLGQSERAEALQGALNGPADGVDRNHPVEGLAVRGRPTYAMWSYKVLGDPRCDVLGNSLAILTGLAPPSRATRMVAWIEDECDALRSRGELALDLPPCLFPFIQPTDEDWRPRYAQYNLPGRYHNGGVWPFVCGFYVAALVAAGRPRLARRKLEALTDLVRPAREVRVAYGFNEWFQAQDGAPSGQDWQTWSASMYLYAAACVERGRALYF
ncbi:glycoside hydrolase 100 family protein [Geothrix sp. 21YS21S-4]|uniref:glycoside hydrolase 100 family protein n=1 Tax=Geothrix sp. 21YS21S-4 TaxID=3068889 RepID=UPI0027BA27E6|nr:glycoside hydrolase 100 family protein [Geothrix sp. 21YS21S-4]